MPKNTNLNSKAIGQAANIEEGLLAIIPSGCDLKVEEAKSENYSLKTFNLSFAKYANYPRKIVGKVFQECQVKRMIDVNKDPKTGQYVEYVKESVVYGKIGALFSCFTNANGEKIMTENGYHDIELPSNLGSNRKAALSWIAEMLNALTKKDLTKVNENLNLLTLVRDAIETKTNMSKMEAEIQELQTRLEMAKQRVVRSQEEISKYLV